VFEAPPVWLAIGIAEASVDVSDCVGRAAADAAQVEVEFSVESGNADDGFAHDDGADDMEDINEDDEITVEVEFTDVV